MYTLRTDLECKSILTGVNTRMKFLLYHAELCPLEAKARVCFKVNLLSTCRNITESIRSLIIAMEALLCGPGRAVPTLTLQYSCRSDWTIQECIVQADKTLHIDPSTCSLIEIT